MDRYSYELRSVCIYLCLLFLVSSCSTKNSEVPAYYKDCGENSSCVVDTFYNKGGFNTLRPINEIGDQYDTSPFTGRIGFERLCDALLKEKKYLQAEKCISEFKLYITNFVKRYEEHIDTYREDKYSMWNLYSWSKSFSHKRYLYNVKVFEARLAMEYNDFKGATKLFVDARSFNQDHLELVDVHTYRLGAISASHANNTEVYNKFHNELLSVFEDVDKNNPKDFYPVKHALADSYFANNNIDAAKLLIEEEEANLGTNYVKLTLGILLLTNPGNMLGSLNGMDVFQGVYNVSTATKSLPENQVVPSLYRRARILFETHRYDESYELYREILALPQLPNHKTIKSMIYHDLSKIWAIKSDKENQKIHLEYAITIIESELVNINTDVGKIAFQTNNQEIYFDYISLLIEQESYELAFNYIEKAKGKALIDLLANKESKKSSVMKQKSLGKEEKEANIKTSSLRSSSSKGLSNFAYSSMISNESASPISIHSLQERIKDNEVLVEYYGFNNKLVAFVITKKIIKVIELDAKTIIPDIASFRAAIVRNDFDNASVLSESIYDIVFSDIHPFLKGKSSLIIVPHDSMHYLPFYALNDGENYLIDQFEVRVLPTASSIKPVKINNEKTQLQNLVLGNPVSEGVELPFAEFEAIYIAEKLENTEPYIGQRASESMFKEFNQQLDIVHFAGHAVINSSQPNRSALLLSKDNRNDGHLTLSEIYGLNLDANLLVLSACETSLGKSNSGNEIQGFNRAFLSAGVKSIISSLWKVDDEKTSQLMTRFYDAREVKKTNSEALRQAILKIKEEQSYDIKSWASFQFVGYTNI